MSAPLHNRYKRYADREAKRFVKGSSTRPLITQWKRPDTRVYSLSDRASYEAGAWSTSSPKDILRAIDSHYLPLDHVWIEFDFWSYQKGVNNVSLENGDEYLLYEGTTVKSMAYSNAPMRLGLMLYHPLIALRKTDEPALRDDIAAIVFYLYPNGTSFIGPSIVGWEVHTEEGREYHPNDRSLMGRLALSKFYMERYRDKNPRLLHRLCGRIYQGMLGIGRVPLATLEESSRETMGTTRMAIAVLTAALSARAHRPAPMESDRQPGTPKTPCERDRPIEVDLFIRERPRQGAGASIKASIGHLETVRKGLHKVGRHYAYRRRDDGGDPTRCTKSFNEVQHHHFERIEGTATEVCLACGQRRWLKKEHQRGDPKYGNLIPKTYNVRVGATSEMNASSPDEKDAE